MRIMGCSSFLILITLFLVLPSVLLQKQEIPDSVLEYVESYVDHFVSGFFTNTSHEVLVDYWGPKSKKGAMKEDESIRPFKINVSERILRDLKKRLRLEIEENRFTPPLEGVGFEYGMNTDYLKNVTNYWLHDYKWRERERRLNKYPQFKTTLDGIEIHFQRITPPSGDKPKRPLLLLHGWPSTFADFQKIIPTLTQPKDSSVNFELIIPSLPGYGFSGRSHKTGLGTKQIGNLLMKLMERLGFSEFYVHGADFGAIIGTDMAILYPKRVLGLHMSMCFTFHYRSFLKLAVGQIYPSKGFQDVNEAKKLFPLSAFFGTILRESGYFHLQATKPDLLGVGLANSPSGLAAYILEKFSTFTNLNWRNRRDGGLVDNFDMDELLDTLTIYWVTNTITSSMRLYYEVFAQNPLSTLVFGTEPVNVPTGCLNMPDDIWDSENEWMVQDKYPQIVHYTKAQKGGHFAAIQVPEILAKDVVDFYNQIEAKNGTRTGT